MTVFLWMCAAVFGLLGAVFSFMSGQQHEQLGDDGGRMEAKLGLLFVVMAVAAGHLA